MYRVVPVGTSATWVQSPHDGDSIPVSANSCSPIAAVDDADGAADDGAAPDDPDDVLPALGDCDGAVDPVPALGEASPPARTETPIARMEPIPDPREVKDAVVASEVGVGVADGAALAPGVTGALVLGDGFAVALGVAMEVAVGVAAVTAAGALVLGEALALGEGLAAINALPVEPTA